MEQAHLPLLQKKLDLLSWLNKMKALGSYVIVASFRDDGTVWVRASNRAGPLVF
jgi:hypothetical protein